MIFTSPIECHLLNIFFKNYLKLYPKEICFADYDVNVDNLFIKYLWVALFQINKKKTTHCIKKKYFSGLKTYFLNVSKVT